MIKETKLYKWLDNFWYHHKWYLMIVIFFVIFIIIATVQMFTKKNADAFLIYTGPHVFSVSEIYEVEYAFEQVMTGDYNDDGEKAVSLLDISLMTEEQVLVAMAEAEEMGYDLSINKNEMIKTEQMFNNQIFAGEAVICMLDPHWFEQVRDAGGFMKLEDILGYKPEGAVDEYGVTLSKTDFGKYFTAFSKFPEDTILCIRTVSTTSIFKGVKKEEKRHAFHVETFKEIMNFKLPEGWVPPTETSAASVVPEV